jgi:DNA-binding CsgD family transcriptional regulator
MAAVAQADREPELAARWLAFDERYRQDRRLVLSPDEASLRMTASEHARAALGDENFAAAWEAGTLLSLDEACEGALAWQLSERAESRPASGLTRREAEVLDLLAGHHTNQEIADQLFLGVRTVETHVANVLAKLGAASRREAVTIAKDRNLLEV